MSILATACAVRITMGIPPMSANTLLGKRLEPIRAGIIIIMKPFVFNYHYFTLSMLKYFS
ncbi:MAG: hypothetical protein Q9M36_14255 [Sulfurovum sp.]|nr:hypothetical protein [Sulfurovum sp.]